MSLSINYTDLVIIAAGQLLFWGLLAASIARKANEIDD